MNNHVTVCTRTALVLVTMIAFASTDASAQTSGEKRANSLVEGKWAIQFEIESEGRLSTFEGTTVSLKKQTSAGAAIQLGVGLDLYVRQDNASDESSQNSSERSSDSNRETIRFVMRKVFYPDPDAHINFFYGLGPTASFSHSGSETDLA